MSTLLLALALSVQDDAKIAEWIRDLGDDAIEVRERATADLVRAGRRAEPALRQAMKGGGEVRGRAALVISEIEKAERTRLFEAGPSRITLRKKDAPLREAIEEIQKQTSCRIAHSFAPEEETVTVSFENTPLFEAVDALCRSARNTSYSVESRRDEVTITLSEGKFADAPRVIKDQYFVRLDSLLLTTYYDLQGGETPRTRFDFRWGWEKGTRPQQALLRIDELVDDLGNSYVGDLPDTGGRPVGFAYVMTQQPIEMAKVPPAGASKFARIKGSLDLSFPESMLVFAFQKPEESAGALQKGEGGSVKLVSCARDRARLRAKIEVRPGDLTSRLDLKAVDKEGREYPGRYTRGEQSTEDAIVMSVEFTLPAAAEAASLQFSSPAGSREKRIPFEFKDVKFR
jgi:hypothetical protein